MRNAFSDFPSVTATSLRTRFLFSDSTDSDAETVFVFGGWRFDEALGLVVEVVDGMGHDLAYL